MLRNQVAGRFVAKSVLFSATTLISGAVVGAALGSLGSLVPRPGRVALALVIGLGAGSVALLGLTGRPLRVPQCTRQTPQNWLMLGYWKWAIRNGLSLGIGASTMIGFWVWFVTPCASFLFGSPLAGALIYGSYGLIRGSMAGFIVRVSRRREGWDYGMWLVSHFQLARKIADATLLMTAVVMILLVGL